MNRDSFDDYRKTIETVKLSASALARTEQAIRDERAKAERKPIASASRRHVFTWRVGAAAACILAVTLGSLLLAPNADRLIGGERSFALSAYASGISPDEASHLKLALGDFAEWGGWYTFDESEWGDEGPYKDDFIHDTGMDKGYICSAYFDLSCEGSGIASLTYELEGEGVYFNFDPAQDTSAPPDDFSCTRFTVAPGDLKDPAKGYIYVVANVPAKGELAEPTAILDEHLERLDRFFEANGESSDKNPNDIFTSEEKSAYDEAQKTIDTLVHSEAASMIGQATFTITATFADGTRESHAYCIAPVEDFRDLYRAHREGHGSSTSLFTIEQVN